MLPTPDTDVLEGEPVLEVEPVLDVDADLLDFSAVDEEAAPCDGHDTPEPGVGDGVPSGGGHDVVGGVGVGVVGLDGGAGGAGAGGA
ncbi:MAG: hypothetical protein WCG47_32970, partial [Dermatophilaceae bacterium]